MTTDVLFPLLLAWASATYGVGCTSTTQATSTQVLRPDIGAVPQDLEADYQVFARNCSKCHELDRPFTAPVTDNHHWELYVAKMMRTPGSGISKVEAPHILRFLFWYTDKKAGRLRENQERTSELVATPPTTTPAEPPAAQLPPATPVPSSEGGTAP